MIISIKKSALFTQDPAIRFAKEYNTDIFDEMIRRRVALDYTEQDLCDYFLIKTGRRLDTRTLNRWLWRLDIYTLAQRAIASGAETVVSDFFGEHELDVIKELTKNISSGYENPKALP